MQEQSYNPFSYLQIFFNFFLYFFSLCAKFPIYAGCPESSLFQWCVPVVSWSWWLFAHYHTHAHTYTRARGFLDYKFLDITVIFRLPRNF